MRFCLHPIRPSIVFAVWISCSVVCHGLQVELNLRSAENANEKKTRLICVHSSKRHLSKRKQGIRNETEDLKAQKHHRSASSYKTEVLTPNVKVNHSNGFRCYFTANNELEDAKNGRPEREVVNSTASITTENGVCKPGYRIDQDRCFPCFPGSYTSGQETECFLCPKDFYMEKEGADACWPCPDGKKTLAVGASSLEYCVYLNEAGYKGWMKFGILLFLFLILSWIIIAFLIIRLLRQRKRKVDVKDEFLGKYLRENSKVDFNQEKNSPLRKRVLNKNSLNQSEDDRQLENIEKETTSETEKVTLPPIDMISDRGKGIKETVIKIHSPAKKNYFFINSNKQGSQTLTQGKSLEKNKDFLNEALKKNSFEMSIDNSESSSNSNSFVSVGSSLTDVGQSEDTFQDKKISHGSKAKRKKEQGRRGKGKTRKKHTVDKTANDIKANQVEADFQNLKSGLFTSVSKSSDSDKGQLLELNKELDIVIIPEDSTAVKKQLPSTEEVFAKFMGTSLECINSKSGEEISSDSVKLRNDESSKNLLSKNSRSLFSASRKNEDGSKNLFSKISWSPFSAERKNYESSKNLLSKNNKSSFSTSLSEGKNVLLNLRSPLYVPPFDQQLIDLKSEPSGESFTSGRLLDITLCNQENEPKSDSINEIKITLEPEFCTNSIQNSWSTRSSLHSSSSESPQLGNEPYVCAFHGPLSSSKSCHVDLNVEFVT